MSKKKLLAAAFIAVLIVSMLISATYVNEARAEILGPLVIRWDAFPSINEIEISTPRNTTYTESSVLLNFTLSIYGSIGDVGYSIDGGEVERITNLTEIFQEPAPSLYLPPYVHTIYWGNLTFSDLSQGNHSITVYLGYQHLGSHKRYEVYSFASANFTISTPTLPTEIPFNPSPTEQPTPAPTLSPTLEPTSTPKQQSGFLGTSLPLEYGYAIIAVAVIAVVALVAVTLRKRCAPK
jgi:hypothetical protein